MSHMPTIHDEEWRYADFDALETVPEAQVTGWSEIAVSPGEVLARSFVLDAATPDVQRLRVTLGEGARAEIFAVNVASAYARLEIEVTLAPKAHFEFGGVLIGGGDVTREFVTRTLHAEPEATSNQTVRAVHWGTASGNYLGRIDVARHAQKTDAAQDFKGLLLEKGASANAKPELEIFADDVKCAHGATVGQLDEMARYYMASRGIAPDVAKHLLIRAFLADALAALEDEAERERLFDHALAALEQAA